MTPDNFRQRAYPASAATSPRLGGTPDYSFTESTSTQPYVPPIRVEKQLVVEVAHRGLTKHKEEICGDWVKITRTKDSMLLVVSDGLGSGIKANILATLTTEIATTMINRGATIEEMIETIAETLPICKIRQIAYATFTVLQVTDGRHAYLVEYDNPALFFVRGGKIVDLPRVARIIAGRTVQEATFELEEDDYLVCVSDGVIHAGVGVTLSLGWGWNKVAKFVADAAAARPSAYELADVLLKQVSTLYDGRPGDDTTIAATRVRPALNLTILTGPPAYRTDDDDVVRRFDESPGTKVVCGGTTAKIVARVLNRPLEPLPLGAGDPEVPPAATLPGISLVTEGIVTINKAIQRLEKAETVLDLPARRDAASELARLLLQADNIRVMVGDAINPMQVADVIRGQAFRQVLVGSLVRELQRKGKIVEVEHF